MASSYQGVRIQKTAIESYSTTTPATAHKITMGAPGATENASDRTNNIMLLQTDTASGHVRGMEFRNYDAGGMENSVALNGTAGLNYIVNKGTANSTVLPVFTIQQIDSTTGPPQIHFDTIYAQKIIAGTVEAHESQYTSITTGGEIYQDIINQRTDAIFNDPWFQKTFVSPPPVLTFNTTTTNTSTDIYIFWTPPVQQAFGFTPYQLPALDGLVLQAATATDTLNITDSTTPGLLTTTNRTPAVTGLKLSWSDTRIGVFTITPPGKSEQSMYCYYRSDLKELINANSTENTLTGYYTNTYNGNNPATVNYGIFTLSPTILVLDNTTNPLAFSTNSRFSTKTVYAVGTSPTAISNLLVSTGTWSTSFHVPVQLAQTAGVSGTVMTLSCSLQTGTNSPVSGGSITFTGFSLTKPADNTANNLAIALTTLVDSYASYSAASQGQFSDVTGTFTATGLSGLAASPSLRTLTLTQAIPAAGSTAAISYSATRTFYSDAVSSVPTIASPSLSMASSGVTGAKVCGVYVVSVPNYSVTYTPANLGTYFYASPLASITGTNLAATTVGIPPAAWLNPGQTAFLATLPATTTPAAGAASPTYATTVTATLVLNNSYGSSTPATATVGVVIDPVSVTIANYALAAPTGTPGRRIQSPSTPATPAVPLIYTNYDNDQVIVGNAGGTASYNNELQLVKGAFQSATSSDGYKNYGTAGGLSTYNNGTLSYTGVTTTAGTYRYATFAWRVQASATVLSIAMNTPSPAIDASSGVAKMNGKALKLYYCFQDTANTTPVAGLQGNYSTQWINGNSNTNQVSNSTYNLTERTGLVSANAAGTFSLAVPFGINYTNQTIYLYCMVGLPMDVQCSFKYLTATMS